MREAREGESAKGENAQRTGMVVQAVHKYDDGRMHCMELTAKYMVVERCGSQLWCKTNTKGSEPNRERSKYAKYGLITKRDTPRNWLDDGWMLLDDARWSALKREKRAKRTRGNAKHESMRKCCAYGAFCRRAVHYIAEVAYGVGRQVREKRAKRARECCALCGKVARLWRVSRESCAFGRGSDCLGMDSIVWMGKVGLEEVEKVVTHILGTPYSTFGFSGLDSRDSIFEYTP
ncbi:hypothetical protein DFJ58DRAFT_850152 [Suillus subalutaceus]|uniref:uncharacterized protein n=1 Tax=Suillus subalutaceus TaxID=48586 RepID=UPI001B873A1C|nr:uncharacterized protein DFJ58DRAFT_850152 [Suillus subalutaceus]KAG1820003.1 hypothetical protein DFJ58DRAFT_850152 [Suillus subalutaceus]